MTSFTARILDCSGEEVLVRSVHTGATHRVRRPEGATLREGLTVIVWRSPQGLIIQNPVPDEPSLACDRKGNRILRDQP